MADLAAFLLPLGGRRREPGIFDCVTMPAEWCIANGYPDPMAHRRGAYDSEEQAQEFIREAGGLVALLDRFLGAVGIAGRDGEPQPGDIGVISIRGEEAGGIFTGQRWALVGERGLIFVTIDAEHVAKAWSVASVENEAQQAALSSDADRD